jgi:hypothetical protein
LLSNLQIMQLTINIPDQEVSFFRELIKRFHYREIVNEKTETLTPEQEEFVQDLKDALRDVELYQAGKKKLKTAREFLDEL